MNDRQIIIKALKAIASAFSFCDTDMELALRDRLNAIYEAIEELANDDSAPKNGVSDIEVDANDANAASVEGSAGAVFVNGAQVFPPKILEHVKDSREKLEADVHALCVELQDHHGVDAVDVWCGSDEQNIFERILLMLDRQASITEREILSHPDERDEQIAELQQQADDLRDEWHRVCAERANLARDLGECMADRDRYRALCGQMLDAAHEIRRIADANTPDGAVL